MSSKGIRIFDLKDGKCISLFELLNEIPSFYTVDWALLWLDVTANNKNGAFILTKQEAINNSINGINCTFSTLVDISRRIFQEINVLIIGDKTKENLHRYSKDQEMYETCDFVIEMIDGGCWEIFSKDLAWIDQLGKKYKKVEFISSDFQSE